MVPAHEARREILADVAGSFFVLSMITFWFPMLIVLNRYAEKEFQMKETLSIIAFLCALLYCIIYGLVAAYRILACGYRKAHRGAALYSAVTTAVVLVCWGVGLSSDDPASTTLDDDSLVVIGLSLLLSLVFSVISTVANLMAYRRLAR